MPRRRLLAAAATAALLVGQAHAELRPSADEPAPDKGPPAPGCPVQAPPGVPVSSVVWTDLLDGQPGWVSSPYKHDLLPPISLPGFCDVSAGAFRSSDFRFVPSQGGEWLAQPVAKTRELEKTGETCRQQLTGLDLMTSKPDWASLRLHFTGCSSAASTIAVRVTTKIKGSPSTGTGEPTVEGIRLLDFMCALSPDECDKVRDVIDTGSEEEKCVLSSKCPGKCDGAGTHGTAVPGKETAQACEDECQGKIDANAADEEQQSCNGYAWSEAEKVCLVYSGFPITTTDESDHATGFYCRTMSGGWMPTTTTRTTTTTKSLPPPVDLELAKLFDEPRAITMRRFQVAPYAGADCYSSFDWYVLDRWLHVSEDDFAIMVKLGKANATTALQPAPRSQIKVERVCVRDCDGKLRDECTAEEDVPPGAAQYKPATAPAEVLSPETLEGDVAAMEQQAQDDLSLIDSDWRSQLRVTMGRQAFNAFSDEQMQPWLAITAVLAIVLAALFSNVLRTSCAEPAPPMPYPRPEDLTLVFPDEGEGEVTMPLFAPGNTVADSMMSTRGGAWASAGPALGSTWQPTRGGTARGPMQSAPPARIAAPPWGTMQPGSPGGSMRRF